MMQLILHGPWYYFAAAGAVVYIVVSYLMAIAAWLLFYRIYPDKLRHRKVLSAFAGSKEVRKELRLSFITLFLHTVAGASVVWAFSRGYTFVYLDISKYGIVWFVLSIPLSILVHDTYFYWTHRIMHHRKIFPIVHLQHHRHTNPTPWAAFSTHPIESFIAGCIYPVLAFTLPLHPIVFLIFTFYMTFMNVMGHAGFEVYPRGFTRHWFGRWHTTPTHHIMHHKYFKGNYGIYFNFWDKLMGTEKDNYHETFDKLTDGRK